MHFCFSEHRLAQDCSDGARQSALTVSAACHGGRIAAVARRRHADPCQPSVSRRTWKRAMQVVRLWHNTRPQPRGSTVSQHPSFYATPSGGRRSRRHQRAATTHRTGKITRTTSILGGGGRRCSRARILGRRAVLERRRVSGRRRREHVGHLRRPQREGRTSRRADHS